MTFRAWFFLNGVPDDGTIFAKVIKYLSCPYRLSSCVVLMSSNTQSTWTEETAITKTSKRKGQPVLFLLLFPTCAWNPLLMALTDLLLPHDSQAMKKIRFSLVRRVSGDLQVLQVTYSTFFFGGVYTSWDWTRWEELTEKPHPCSVEAHSQSVSAGNDLW